MEGASSQARAATTGTTTGAPDVAGTPASGTSTRNVDGAAVALTVFSAVRRWGLVELPLFFLYIRRRPGALHVLRRLSFIHAARWSIVRRLPANGSMPEVRLRYPRLYFESNFNGGWEEYIDAFSYVLTLGMFAFWGSSHGFTSAIPAGPFKAYIRQHAYTASSYYSAYPEATATTILAALELEPRVLALRARAPDLSPEEFARRWAVLLREVQPWL
ncbi:MAG: hypothetical protein ACXVFN_11270 [Solirubrobacteraceae bacterium]